MFKLNPAPTFVAPVPLSVPGLPEPVNVTVTYRYKNKAALSAWLNAMTGKDNVALLHEVIDGWAGISDAAGADVPYSLTALTDLLANYSAAHNELFHAYLRELTEAKTKN